MTLALQRQLQRVWDRVLVPSFFPRASNLATPAEHFDSVTLVSLIVPSHFLDDSPVRKPWIAFPPWRCPVYAPPLRGQ